MNLKQGKIYVNEYALKFHQMLKYAPDLVSDMRARMRRVTSRLSQDLILESKTALLIKDMDILRLVVHMQQVEDEKRKHAKFRERQGKKSRFFEQGGGQQQGSRDSSKWPKKKWGSFGSYSSANAPYPKSLVDRHQ